MGTLKIRYPWPTKVHNAFGTCILCSPKVVQFELRFDTGSVEPVAGEILTGGSSTDTGVVASVTFGAVRTEVVLESGTWAGGDAVGFIVLESCTGITDDSDDGRHCFEDNEAVTGDSGATLVADDVATEKVYMIPWPRQMLYKYEGKYYCPYHYEFRQRCKELDKAKLPASIFQDPIYWKDGQ